MATGITESIDSKIWRVATQGDIAELSRILRTDRPSIPKGLITHLSKFETMKNILIVLCAFATPFEVNENYGMPLYNAIVFNAQQNIEILLSFYAGYEAFRLDAIQKANLNFSLQLTGGLRIENFSCINKTIGENLLCM